ncbi:MAG TPA: MFS transporter [Coriobacteriia bacterium]|nr:MFS transporter [Coriobacteriia bacterium]
MNTAPAPRRRFGPLALLESAVLVSGIGNGIAAVTIPWLVLERTGQATSAGLVGAATALPLLLSALFSGSIVDTFGRRRTSIVSDALSALSVAAIPLVDRWLGLDMTLILALVVLGAVFDPAGATAREAMIPELGAEARWPLPRTNAVHEATWGVSYLIGPAVGGVLIATVGPATTLWATAIGFVFSGATVAFIRAPGVGTPEKADRPKTVLAGSAEGVRLVWRDPLLRATTLLSMLIVAVYLPIEGVVLPYIFQQQGRPAALGLVLTALSAGGLVGALSYAAVGPRMRRYPVFAGAIVLASVSILAMALAPSYGLLVAAAALAGLFWGPVDPLINLAMQTRTDPVRRGRVLGVLMASYYAAGPLGYIGAGLVVERFGAQTAFIALGAVILVVAVIAAPMRALRLFDEPGVYDPDLEGAGAHVSSCPDPRMPAPPPTNADV